MFESNYAEAGLHKINNTKQDWSDLIAKYRTIQSPSKKNRIN
jgi:hypothetical protein